MTLAEKLAALPEMPPIDMPLAAFLTFPMDPRFRAMCQREIETTTSLRARLALLLETVRAYTEANENFPMSPQNLKPAYDDLRTLQAHLEGERT